MDNLILPDDSMLTIITNRKTQKPVTALSPWTEYQMGYNAYVLGNGPGVGSLRTAGWLQAWRDQRSAIEEEIRYANDRLDANDRYYRWQY